MSSYDCCTIMLRVFYVFLPALLILVDFSGRSFSLSVFGTNYPLLSRSLTHWLPLFFHNLYCFVFISVYVMLLLAVLVTIGPSAFNKFGLVWFGLNADCTPFLSNHLQCTIIISCTVIRSQNFLHITYCATYFSRHSFSFSAPAIWNELPTNIRESNPLDIFTLTHTCKCQL